MSEIVNDLRTNGSAVLDGYLSPRLSAGDKWTTSAGPIAFSA